MKNNLFNSLGKMVLIFLLSLVVPMGCYAKDIKRPDSYNFKRAFEALQEQKTEEAAEFFKKELEDNPKNGYAYYWIGCIALHEENLGVALSSVKSALKLIPKKDKEYVAAVYATLSDIYNGLDEHQKALEHITKAIKVCPEEDDYYEKRGQLYFEQEKYDQSNQDYLKIIELDEGSVMGYMGIGRNEKMRGNYDKALERFTYVMKLANNYSSAYSFRAETYLRQGKYNEAINDALHALSMDGDQKAYYVMEEIADSSLVLVKAKLQLKAKKEPANSYWPFCIGHILERHNDYPGAIEAFAKSFELDGDPITSYRLSTCYIEAGDNAHALEYVNYSIERDSLDMSYQIAKAAIYYELGENAKAISQMDKCVELSPEDYFVYNKRGFYKAHTGDHKGALEDFTMSIIQNPTNAISYLFRGDMYSKLGEKEKAIADYEKVVELDTVPKTANSAFFALFELGKVQEAKDLMKEILDYDPTNAGNLYDAACLYSRMNEVDKALDFLDRSLKLDRNSFQHMHNDYDLENIRHTEGFKKLLEKYSPKENTEKENESDAEFYEEVSVVPFIKESGVTKVRCSINDLPLFLVFDTGAADVSLSNVEAAFMFKNGYLSSQDVIGSQNYMNADGSITTGTKINLKEVEFGGIKLSNINASIVNNQQAPLLLGQSVLKRLGKIEIDNKKQVLKITQKKLKKE